MGPSTPERRDAAGIPGQRIGVVGAGLIGGSIAHAAAASAGGPGDVVVWDADPATRDALRAAGFRLASGVEDLGRTVDIAVVAVPPTATARNVVAVLGASGDVIVADAASVKRPVWDEVRALTGASELARFVPAHPLAGSAAHGWASAGVAVLADAVWAVCPDADATDPAALTGVLEAITGRLAGRVLMVGAAEHDRALAYTSHMPHLAASALVRCVAADVGPLRFRLSGGSLRDATRVAAASTALWKDILRHNRDNLLTAIDELGAQLDELRALVADERWQEFCDRWETGVAEREDLQRIRWEPGRPRTDDRRPMAVAPLLALGATGSLICSVTRDAGELLLEIEPA